MILTTALIILTHDADAIFERQMEMVARQTLQPVYKLIIDTVSSDAENISSATSITAKNTASATLPTAVIAKFHGFVYHAIKQADFDHGATRQLATELVDADIYIFMTQDAVFADANALANLVAAFLADKKVGCAYGRQLPHHDASILAAHARAFNYPAVSAVKSYGDRGRLGIKTCFNSDSFAAYLKTALQEIGGFPSPVILGEDTLVAAKMLMQGWKVAYCADACIHHSHNYSILREFKRYFDIGAFHAANLWLLQNFHEPRGEGVKYVKSEFAYCWSSRAYLALLRSVFTVGAKYAGYRSGRHFARIPPRLRKKLSMNHFYWK